jgi:hypothetical protein
MLGLDFLIVVFESDVLRALHGLNGFCGIFISIHILFILLFTIIHTRALAVGVTNR